MSEAALPGPARSGARGRSAAIDGIRGMAALALLTVHVAMFSGLLGTRALGEPRPPSNFLGAFFVSGLPSFIGVFFVLPALFLYLPLAKAMIAGTERPPQGRGLLRRLLRLLPGYYVMFLVVLVALNRDAIDSVWFVLRPILLLHVYLPSPFVPKLINGMEVSWTVPSMVQWYAALPVLAWATHRFAARGATPAARARRLMLPVPILIAVGIGWLLFVKAQGWDNRIVFWWPLGFAPTIGIGMGLAVMLALVQVAPESTPRLFRAVAARPNLFLLAALVVYFVNCARPFSVIGMDSIYSTPGLLSTYVLLALFGLFSVLPMVVPGARSRLIDATFGTRPAAYLGRISYGIYLWHFAVIHFCLQPGSIVSGHCKPLRELYGSWGFWPLEAATVTGAVIMASLSLRLVEEPVAAWGDRLIKAWARRRDGDGPSGRPRPAGASKAGAAPAGDGSAVAVAAAVEERDAVQANLLDLDSTYRAQRTGPGPRSPRTKERWEAAGTDLTVLWEIYDAYAAVVDRAAELLGPSGRTPAPAAAEITALLTGPSVLVVREPAPLARRHITDSGRVRMTPAAAVERMHELFARTAEVVAAVEDEQGAGASAGVPHQDVGPGVEFGRQAEEREQRGGVEEVGDPDDPAR
jgi:peptidoglycan/LPS O-acetylase OafA/YrhL